MSLIPAFEIGLWNAWIPMFYLASHPLLIRLIAGKDTMKRLGGPANLRLTNTQKRISNFSTTIFVLLIIYSVFLPLRLGTLWFYIGLAICLIGLITFTIAIVNIANIPTDEPFTRGLYRYSRHPMYATYFIALIGMGIASASWIFLLLSIVHIAPSFILATSEERWCLELYGDTYREYMNRTPRWIGMPKAGKSG